MEFVKSRTESAKMSSKGSSTMKRNAEVQMKRTALLAISTVALIGSACAEPEPSLLLTGHIPLVGATVEEGEIDFSGCEPPGSIDDVELVSGSVFINLAEVEDSGAGFSIGLLMENRLQDSSSYAPIGHDQNQRLNQNHVEVQSYEVTFDGDSTGFSNLGDGGALSYPSSGLVTTDGALWVQLELFRASEIGAWQDAFAAAAGDRDNAIVPTFAEIQVRGETVGGQNVRSNILTMPIQICDGCSQGSTPICAVGN